MSQLLPRHFYNLLNGINSTATSVGMLVSKREREKLASLHLLYGNKENINTQNFLRHGCNRGGSEGPEQELHEGNSQRQAKQVWDQSWQSRFLVAYALGSSY